MCVRISEARLEVCLRVLMYLTIEANRRIVEEDQRAPSHSAAVTLGRRKQAHTAERGPAQMQLAEWSSTRGLDDSGDKQDANQILRGAEPVGG